MPVAVDLVEPRDHQGSPGRGRAGRHFRFKQRARPLIGMKMMGGAVLIDQSEAGPQRQPLDPRQKPASIGPELGLEPGRHDAAFLAFQNHKGILQPAGFLFNKQMIWPIP